MSDGHRTTCIPRPRDATRASSATRAPTRRRFAEFTRPIAKDKQLVKGRGKRLVFALVAVVIAAALIASLFVLPVKSWLQQRDDLARKQQRARRAQQRQRPAGRRCQPAADPRRDQRGGTTGGRLRRRRRAADLGVVHAERSADAAGRMAVRRDQRRSSPCAAALAAEAMPLAPAHAVATSRTRRGSSSVGRRTFGDTHRGFNAWLAAFSAIGFFARKTRSS